MFIWKQITRGIQLQTYLVGDELEKVCVVIDPSRNIEPIIKKAKEKGFEIQKIIETHIHADFISGALELKNRLKNKPEIILSGEGLSHAPYGDKKVKNNEEIKIGKLTLKAIFTPGHTPEHLSWLLLDEKGTAVSFFTGDFLFAGDVGRPDLLGDKNVDQLSQALYESCFTRLNDIPDDVEVMPAHGAGSSCAKSISKVEKTTVGLEKSTNPALQIKAFSDWKEDLLKDMPKPPPYFSHVKKQNTTGLIESMENLKKQFKALGPDEVNSCLIIDVRSKEAFSDGHIENSLFLGLSSPQFLSFAGWLIPNDKPLVIVASSDEEAKKAAEELFIVGFENIKGYLKEGIKPWPEPLKSFKNVNKDDLKSTDEIMDVRTQKEWDQGHIPNSHHHPLQAFTLPKDKNKTWVSVCQSGYRATIAASILEQQGFPQVEVLQGGMEKWNKPC